MRTREGKTDRKCTLEGQGDGLLKSLELLGEREVPWGSWYRAGHPELGKEFSKWGVSGRLTPILARR